MVGWNEIEDEELKSSLLSSLLSTYSLLLGFVGIWWNNALESRSFSYSYLLSFKTVVYLSFFLFYLPLSLFYIIFRTLVGILCVWVECVCASLICKFDLCKFDSIEFHFYLMREFSAKDLWFSFILFIY